MKLVTAINHQKTLIHPMTVNDSIHPSWLNPEHDDGFEDKKFRQCTNCDHTLFLEDVENNLCSMCGHEIISDIWR